MAQRYGDGTLFKRGRIYYFQYFESGKPRQVSTRSERMDEVKKFRDRLLGKKLRGELNPSAEKITCGQLLDDVLRHVQEKRPRRKSGSSLSKANLRPFFGHLKAATVSTDRMREYRDKRKAEGRRPIR